MSTLFVLDIDDTVTRSESQHQAAYLSTLKRNGIHEINQNWEEYEHMTDSYILKTNYERNLKEKFSFELIDRFEQQMTAAILKLPPVSEVNGAGEVLRQILAQENTAISFATGSFKQPALLKLKQAQISTDEAIVVGSNNHLSREEVVTASIEAAMSFYKVGSFDRIISVGDGMWDWKTAKNLKIEFIGIGSKGKADFKAAGVVNCMDDWTGFGAIRL